MKIIELLNKIANGEDVPKKIMYFGLKYEYCDKCKQYENVEENIRIKLFEEIVELNDEVEIIEEEKKIPEKIKDKYCSQISKVELAQKYNEIIDYLKSKGE